MPHPVDAREELISLVTAALRAAEVDAKTGKLIFRDEWRPTPRTMPPSAGAHQDPFWWDPILARWGVQPQQDQPLPPASTSTSGGARPDVGRGAGRADAQEEVLQARTQQDVEGAVAELLKRNHGVFDKIISHSFPRKLGDGTASLDGFRYYMIQDMKYLEACAQLKMIAAGNAHDFEEVRAFDARHKKSLQYVDNLKTICITKLGIPTSIIEATPRSDELKTSERFYKVALQDRHEDALFGFVSICFFQLRKHY
ncbi:hypothetical protein PISMIDRAFT_24847 [Pisolithus microcarpus 441]|uniref:Thiaminase-2/PQQC domain-containing protein n=1 Tax=Pisolithus microcarpus 441 TaxID=765257 RepID=A0A0C9ZCJ8_9AGAM|nr:hypothetical protein PISMIDRAFT_24847 [Pisolithus microcarpus 441]